MVIHGERASHGRTLCLALRARRLLQQGLSGFLAYFSDTRVEATPDMSKVLIVRDFPDVFSEDLHGVPPERQVEFHIDLVLRVAPIAKALYCLAPDEMQELSTQLQELLDRSFILPSSSPWGVPIMFMKRNDGLHRMCIDNRELN